jgi:predicted secreted protein
MAILNGTELKVYSSGTTNLVAFAQNCTVTVNNTTRETTNKESNGFKEVLESLRDWSVDLDGAYAWTNAAGSALGNGADDLTSKMGLTSVTEGAATGLSALIGGGTGYTTPTTNRPTTGGTGVGLTLDIVISGGVVQSIAINSAGTGYTSGDTITVAATASNTPTAFATFTLSSVGGSVTTTNTRQQFDVIFGDTSTSDVSYSGKVYITSLSMTGGTEDTATYSATLEGTGPLTSTTN